MFFKQVFIKVSKNNLLMGGRMSMGEDIKILLIEDNPGDAFLIEEHLDEFANFHINLKLLKRSLKL